MKLYKFTFSEWGRYLISRSVLEVEEKPKTYTVVKGGLQSRILKSDVGVLSGYGNDTLYLLEDDMQKAREMFTASLKHKIENEKISIVNVVESKNKRIKKYESMISQLGESEGV